MLGTGRRLSLGFPESGRLPSDEDEAAVKAGAVPVTVEAFVEFDAGDGYVRWSLDYAAAVVLLEENHTSALLRAATMDNFANDHPVAELGINGMAASRWQAAAAPHRLELDPDLAAKLTIA